MNIYLLHDLCPKTKCYDARPYNQEMVTSNDNQVLQGTKKLSSHHKRRGNLQEDASTLKPIHTQWQARSSCKIRPYVDTYKTL